MRKTILGAVIAAATLASAALPALAATQASAAASAVTYTKAGTYKFAANDGATFRISARPASGKQASQSLGADGVDLATAPDSSGYADSGVIVPLGRLDSLFHGAGQAFRPPAIAGSGLAYNLYFDTNGNGGYLSFASNGTYLGPDGDNIADLGAPGNSGDAAVFQAGQQGNTSLGLSGTMTMEKVLAAFNGRTDGGAKNPQVWAWIGISGATAQTAHVTSVDGKNLVKTSGTAPPPPACTPGSPTYNFVMRATVPFYLGVPDRINADGKSAAELKPSQNASAHLARCTKGGYTEFTVTQGGVTYALTTRATAAGAKVTLEPAHEYASQLWTVSGTAQQTFRSAKTGLYLRVRNIGPLMYDSVSTGTAATAWSQG